MSSVPSLPATIGGKYTPLRLIARGGMGVVYEVVEAGTGKHFALKLMLARSLLKPELVARFSREARIQSSMKSEHVVRVIDSGVAPEIDGAPFLVMELLVGKDFERICTEGRPAVADALGWLRQVGHALDNAHRERVIHRDLKPENLFLAELSGQPPLVKILDFGIAKILTETNGESTVTGQILGTPRYMAPEQAAGAKKQSAAVDRFALGLITFRLVCGRHYFEGENWPALMRAVTQGPLVPPSGLACGRGQAFDRWFLRACAVDPKARFGSCAEQMDALSAAIDGIPAVVRGMSRRSRRLLGGVAVAGACGALTLWGMFRNIAHLGVESATASLPSISAGAMDRDAPVGVAVVSGRLQSVPAFADGGTHADAASLLSIERTRDEPLRRPIRRHGDRRSVSAGVPPAAETVPPASSVWDEP